MSLGDEFLSDVARAALLTSLTDAETIRYRQDILKDCLENADLTRSMYALAVEGLRESAKNSLASLEVPPAASSIDREGFWTCCCPCCASSKRSLKKMPAHSPPMVWTDFSGCSAKSLMLIFLRARDRTSGNCSSRGAFSSARVWEKATRPPVSFFMKRKGPGWDGYPRS